MKELKKTALNQLHHELKAKMGDFAGWEMPIWYVSIIEEHNKVRSSIGIFDVSDMGRVEVIGKHASAFLDKLLTKPVAKLEPGSSQLCLMCLEDGGILDDLFVYRIGNERYLIVWNADNTKRKLDWLQHWAIEYPDVIIKDVSNTTGMLAVQGPKVSELDTLKCVAHLSRFSHTETEIGNAKVFVARTGYTGEDGFEIITDAVGIEDLWRLLMQNGAAPCGIGARDSLRLEAGMALYGQDIDTSTNPYEAGLGYLVNLNDGNFIGKQALLIIKNNGVQRKLVGFRMLSREIARRGYKIMKDDRKIGTVTSGGYAPTIGSGIGLGYVPAGLADIGTDIEIVIRNCPVKARVDNRRFLLGEIENEPKRK